MQKVLYFIFVLFIGFNAAANGQMSLKLSNDISYEQPATLGNHNLESNLKLELPAGVTAPASSTDIVRGMILLGILADISFPMGSDTAFNHIAKTGFSGHVMVTYALTATFLIQLRAGYNTFGTKTEEGNEPGYSYKYEDSYSQIPILFGAYYLFATRSAFRPYIGVALGLFLQRYAVKWQESGFGYDFNLDDSFTKSAFGIVPGAGFYFALGAVMLQVAVEYAILLGDAPTVAYDVNLGKVSSGNAVTTTYEETLSKKPSYLSVLLGIAFPLGGN